MRISFAASDLPYWLFFCFLGDLFGARLSFAFDEEAVTFFSGPICSSLRVL